MTQHTPTPWFADGATIRGDRTRECNDSDFIADTRLTVGGIPLPSCEANAAHIVRCVNSHDDLLVALVNLTNTLSAHDEDGLTEQAEVMIAARSAIAKARA